MKNNWNIFRLIEYYMQLRHKISKKIDSADGRLFFRETHSSVSGSEQKC